MTSIPNRFYFFMALRVGCKVQGRSVALAGRWAQVMVVLPPPFSLIFLGFLACSLLLSKHRLLCLLPTVKALRLGLLPDLCLMALCQHRQPGRCSSCRTHEMARGHGFCAGRAPCGLAGPVVPNEPWVGLITCPKHFPTAAHPLLGGSTFALGCS